VPITSGGDSAAADIWTQILPDIPASANPTDSIPALNAAFKSLTGLLRGLPEIPLSIISIQSVHPGTVINAPSSASLIRTDSSWAVCSCLLSSAFRHCAVFPPRPIDFSSLNEGSTAALMACAETVDVVLQFEYSAAWPDDLMV